MRCGLLLAALLFGCGPGSEEPDRPTQEEFDEMTEAYCELVVPCDYRVVGDRFPARAYPGDGDVDACIEEMQLQSDPERAAPGEDCQQIYYDRNECFVREIDSCEELADAHAGVDRDHVCRPFEVASLVALCGVAVPPAE